MFEFFNFQVTFEGFGIHFEAEEEFIESIFPCYHDGPNPEFSNRIILTTLNETVDHYNDHIISKSSGLSVTYMSVDRALTDEDSRRYPVEFLNTINPGCMPKSKLILKIGVPFIVIRSINPPIITNGTRCIVTGLLQNVIQARITHGSYRDTNIYIPRIPIIPSDKFSIPFKRLQFPIKISYAMTITRSQAQTFTHVACDLKNPPFTHGQLYVAISRVTHPNNLRLILPNNRIVPNIVFKEVLDNP